MVSKRAERVSKTDGVAKLDVRSTFDGVRGLAIILKCSTHIYMKVCASVGRSVSPSVRGPSVARFFLIADFDKKHYRIIGKVETLFLDCNNLQKNFKTKIKNRILKQNFKTKF